jgi:hypothetical protein
MSTPTATTGKSRGPRQRKKYTITLPARGDVPERKLRVTVTPKQVEFREHYSRKPVHASFLEIYKFASEVADVPLLAAMEKGGKP